MRRQCRSIVYPQVAQVATVRLHISFDPKHKSSYQMGMNKLPLAKRTQILAMLCEGSSMRSISRIADVSINTVSKLLVEAEEPRPSTPFRFPNTHASRATGTIRPGFRGTRPTPGHRHRA